MDEKPEALRLAQHIEDGYYGHCPQAAAELRRLHEVNAELLEALCKLVEHDEYLIETGVLRPFIEVERARAVIAKAEERNT